jgi:hypothetical protein
MTKSSGARALKYGGLILIAVLAVLFVVNRAMQYATFDPTHFGRYWPVRWWLIPHIAGGALAVVLGPAQFMPFIRRRALALHRWSGRLYLLGVTVGSASAFDMAIFHTQPRSFAVALFSLGVAWVTTTSLALIAVLNRNLSQHREWMVRSYVVTFAFVSFRLLAIQPDVFQLGSGFLATWAWACWTLPLLCAEICIQLPQMAKVRKIAASRKAVAAE